MGSIGDCFDHSVAESFFGTLQLELLDEQAWTDRQQLALAVFDWIEAWYNPAPPALLLPHAQPHRLRDHPRGMIPTTHPSARTGEAHASARDPCGAGGQVTTSSEWVVP
jgi:transposase InsO family protein